MVVPERPLLALHNRNITVVVQDQHRTFEDQQSASLFAIWSRAACSCRGTRWRPWLRLRCRRGAGATRAARLDHGGCLDADFAAPRDVRVMMFTVL